jgi:hypothetical protein
MNTADLKVTFNLPFEQLQTLDDLIPMEIKKQLVELQPKRYNFISGNSEKFSSIKMDSADIRALLNYNPDFDVEMDYTWHLSHELESVIKNPYQLNYYFGTDYWHITAKKNLNKLDFLDLLKHLEILLGEAKFKNSVGYSYNELEVILKKSDELFNYCEKISSLMKVDKDVSYLEELSKFPLLKVLFDRIKAFKTKYGSLNIDEFKLPAIYSDGINTIKITSFNKKLKTFSAIINLEGKKYILDGNKQFSGDHCKEPIITTVGFNRTDLSKRYNSENTLNYSLAPNGFDDRYGPGVGPPMFYIDLIILKSSKENLIILQSADVSDIRLKKTYYLKLI